jgi:hypothetical protein
VGASYHHLELVRRGPNTYFVTCTNSPRFNWSVKLSHKDVGQNLDYFAPGHMVSSGGCRKSSVFFVEKSSFVDLSGEWVVLEYLDDKTRQEWKQFNGIREKVWNEAFRGLGLEYRIKCLVAHPGMLESIERTMAERTPPSSMWWDKYGYFVNGFLFPGITQHTQFAFCGFDTKHEEYWPLIQSTFHFMLRYRRNEYWYTCSETGKDYWKSMELLCTRLRTAFASDFDAESYGSFSDEIEREFGRLSELTKPPKLTQPAISNNHRRRIKYRCLLFRRRVMYLVWEIKEILVMHLVERRKVRARLSHPGIAHPRSGDRGAFESWFKLPDRVHRSE